MVRRCRTDVENTPPSGQASAAGSAVTAYTVRTPSSAASTRSTATPGSPNRIVVPSPTTRGPSHQLIQSTANVEGPRPLTPQHEDRVCPPQIRRAGDPRGDLPPAQPGPQMRIVIALV